jgi:hypothetical protein
MTVSEQKIADEWLVQAKREVYEDIKNMTIEERLKYYRMSREKLRKKKVSTNNINSKTNDLSFLDRNDPVINDYINN